MLKKYRSTRGWTVLLACLLSLRVDALPCGGRFPNPITDVCWGCLFPIYIAGAPFTTTPQTPNFDPPPPPVCVCPKPPLMIPIPGIGLSFWEPAQIAEVVRTPLCSPTLGGLILGAIPAPMGTNEGRTDKSDAFYHVHWIDYPILSWIGAAISQGACLAKDSMDFGYLSELDPLWNDDELGFILNPEVLLFANPVSQLACAADSLTASVAKFGLDFLFWCSGTQGSVFPLTGNHSSHNGGIDTSLTMVHRLVFKLHRMIQLWDTSTPLALCQPIPQPIMRKTQYKQNLIYPVPQNITAFGFGSTSMLWGAAKEFPYKGEDFSYLVWRKKQCCAF